MIQIIIEFITQIDIIFIFELQVNIRGLIIIMCILLIKSFKRFVIEHYQ
jgi:hypothetical protein